MDYWFFENCKWNPKHFDSFSRYLVGAASACVAFFLLDKFVVIGPCFSGYEVPVSLIGSYMAAKIVIITWRNLLKKKDLKESLDNSTESKNTDTKNTESKMTESDKNQNQ